MWYIWQNEHHIKFSKHSSPLNYFPIFPTSLEKLYLLVDFWIETAPVYPVLLFQLSLVSTWIKERDLLI